MNFNTTVRRSFGKFALEQTTRRLMLKIAEGLKEEAIKPALELTSGNISTEQLARMGHPFARSSRTPGGRLRRGRSAEVRQARRLAGRIARLPVNRQSGALQRSLKMIVRSGGEGVWRLTLETNHPHAVVLAPAGTTHMIPRGFVEEVTRRTNSRRMLTRLRAIIRKTRLS